MTVVAARSRLAAFGAQALVVFGSGLAVLPHGAVVHDELAYVDLGWPCTAVRGHANVLRLVKVAGADSCAGTRLALACGRPHAYEGWPQDALPHCVRDVVGLGVPHVVLTNSCGSLRAAVQPGDVVVCDTVVDLQAAPSGPRPSSLPVCPQRAAVAVAQALASGGPARTGTYVAVAGPQFESPAEVAWLGRWGAVVGMSAAPEVRAAHDLGAEACLLALVVNRAAEVGSHDDVLVAGSDAAGRLAAGLLPALTARWPGLI